MARHKKRPGASATPSNSKRPRRGGTTARASVITEGTEATARRRTRKILPESDDEHSEGEEVERMESDDEHSEGEEVERMESDDEHSEGGEVNQDAGKEEMNRRITIVETTLIRIQESLSLLLDKSVPSAVDRTNNRTTPFSSMTASYSENHAKSILREILRSKVFKTKKFIVKKKELSDIYDVIKKMNQIPSDVNFKKTWIKEGLCRLRCNTQMNAKRSFLQEEDERLREEHLAAMRVKVEGKNVSLPDFYRDYDGEDENAKDAEAHFKWFIEHILGAMNPKESQFNYLKKKKRLSEIFSVTDEAWGLMILLNEGDLWTKHKTRKKYTSKTSGKGWDEEGMDVWDKLCELVSKSRGTTSSEQWEEDYKRLCCDDPDSTTGNNSSTTSSSYEDIGQAAYTKGSEEHEEMLRNMMAAV